MKVCVQVGGQRMDIVCGKGGQNVRWLALVASQRLQLMQPKGRQRSREAGDARRGFALPKAVLLRDGGCLDDPDAKIKEVIDDGDEVEVLLMNAVEVDDVGAPVASEWFLKAFGSGEATKRRLNGVRLRQEYEAKLKSDEDACATGDRGDGPPRFGSRGASGGFDVTVEGVAISGSLETAGEIRVAMEYDWRSADIGGLLDDPKEAVAVKGLLQAHLPALNQVYASRSGGSLAAGSASAMSFHDFAHTMHRYGVMSWVGAEEEKGEETTAMRKVFDKAGRGRWPGSGHALNRAQFLGALVLAARAKGGKIEESLKEIVQDKLLELHAKAMADAGGVILSKAEVQCFVSDNRRLLNSVYLLYADPSEHGALITLDQFRELMDDCGVMSAMTATGSGKNKFDFLAETCFLQVQGKPPLPSLVFTECIEASCRLAIMSAEDSSPSSGTSAATPPAAAFHASGTPADSGGPPHSPRKELDAVFLVLDCIIDLGLGDRGLPEHGHGSQRS